MVTIGTKWFIALEVLIYLIVSISGSESVDAPAHRNMRNPSKWHNAMPRELSCPTAGDIKPCECSTDENHNMFMDCSKIGSEEELKSVFNHNFSFTDFQELKINHNENLEALREGDLSISSFVKINLFNCSIREIENPALMASYDTLEALVLSRNELASIPSISNFKRIAYVNAEHNALTTLPILSSLTLKYLYLGFNRIQTIPEEATKGLPSLINFHINANSVSHILPGSFTTNEHLTRLYLEDNNLETIPLNAIKLYGLESRLYLHYNQITVIPAGSFSGVSGRLYINHNNLTVVDEEVWRPLLEDNVEIHIADNPFRCGCDLAWLIRNQTLLDRLNDLATCQDGEAFIDLDPSMIYGFC